jgi:hypothetical protein
MPLDYKYFDRRPRGFAKPDPERPKIAANVFSMNHEPAILLIPAGEGKLMFQASFQPSGIDSVTSRDPK